MGTTGLLVASSLLLLTVVGAFVAFDSWPNQAAAEPETVAIAAEPALRAGHSRTVRFKAFGRSLRRASAAPARRRARAAAARARVAERGGARVVKTGVADRVVSDLPAPEVATSAPEVTAPAGPGKQLGSGTSSTETGTGTGTGLPQLPPVTAPTVDVGTVTDELGETVTGVSPEAGSTVPDTGRVLDGVLPGQGG